MDRGQADINHIRRILKKRIPKKRYRHSESVAYLASSIAMCYGKDPKPAFMAGLLHDCARFMSDVELFDEYKRLGLPYSEEEERMPLLLHSKMGAYIAEKEYGIHDRQVLDAISYHISGRPGMTFIEQSIFLADFVEIWRTYLDDGEFVELRGLVFHDLDKATYKTAEYIIRHLEDKGDVIDDMIYATLDYYKAL